VAANNSKSVEAVVEEVEAAPGFGVKTGDEVLYCTGYKDTGEKGEDGNRILEPEYAPATVYQVDEERTATGHVLLVYTDNTTGQKIGAYAHNGDATPGYWTAKKPE
jgi:hypothetical protein